jgi:hypothetical protein
MNDTDVRLQFGFKAGRVATVLVAVVATILFTPDHARATLPAIPQGCAVLNTGNKAIHQPGILNNPNVDIISIAANWSAIESQKDIYTWDSIDGDLTAIADSEYGSTKSAVLRINTMGGSSLLTGNTPDWVFDEMGVPNNETTPGFTYGFIDGGDQTQKYIPVFWDPTYLAKKKAMIAAAGAHITSDLDRNATVKVVVISYANAVTEDWYVPHDGDQADLWLEDPPAGAGYTTQKMIDAAIHQADATFSDGVVKGRKLTSNLANFTQADIGCKITGVGYGQRNSILKWLGPTQVLLKNPLRGGDGKVFTLVGRKDGLIDVAMAAFPNQYVATAVGGNGADLDASYGGDPGTVLAETVNAMVQAVPAYVGRYIVQRNNVTAIIPTKDDATDAWTILADAANAHMPTAGQALGVAADNEAYRMNNKTNCDWDRSECEPDESKVCDPECALSYEEILDRSADRLYTYSPSYYEIYPTDASKLQDSVCYIHYEFRGLGQCPP